MFLGIVYGVDPDLRGCGVGCIDVGGRCVKWGRRMSVVGLLEELRSARLGGVEVKVYVEAGWRVLKSNFHGGYGRRAERIAHDVGVNHGVGMLLVELLRGEGFDVEEVMPLRKVWGGRDKKITREELMGLTGWGERSNQDVRDAVLLGWVCSGF